MGLEKLLLNKQLLVVCGVGGVGKTTLSAALGLKGAKLRKRALVITVDPAKRLAELLNLKSPCPDPKQVWQDQKNHGSLSACLLEAKQTFDHLIQRYAAKNIRASILNNPLYQQISLMLAGTQEYMAMEKLYSLSTEEQFDLIVVDTPPAKQAIDFLLAPIRLIHMLNDSILRWLILPTLKVGTLSSKVISALSHLSGKEILEEIAHLMQISLSLLEGFTKRSEAIQALLLSKKCAFIMVTDIHRAFALDGQTLREEFVRLGFELEGILINRMPLVLGEDQAIPAALQWIRKQKDPQWEPLQTLLAKHHQTQKILMKRLQPLIASVPYAVTLPEMPEGVVHFEDLHALAAKM